MKQTLKYFGSGAKQWYYNEAPARLAEGEAVRVSNMSDFERGQVPTLYRSKRQGFIIGPDILIPYGIVARKAEPKMVQKVYDGYGTVYFRNKYIDAVALFYKMIGKELPVEEKVVEGEKVNVPAVKKGRGRPSVPMNELKAKNILRATKKGPVDSDKIKEASSFLVALGQQKFVKKYIG